jgi:predicted nucleic acid binding AN1-type Zn finger protein
MRVTVRVTGLGVAACLLLETLGVVSPAAAQTRINLQYQSRDADFRSQAATKPFSIGTALPAVCDVGQAFFKTNADPGSNLYMCIATNIWTNLHSSSAESISLKPFRVSNAVLTIGSSCSPAAPCTYGFTSMVAQVTNLATITLNSGGGTLLGYLDRSSGLIVAPPDGMSVTCSGCTVATGVQSFPWDAIPLFRWSASSGVWESVGTDLNASLRREVLVAGENITLAQNGDATIISATPSAGGVSSADATSVDGELALFSGTSGAQIKRATGSGFLKATSGVLSSVSGIQETDIAPESKQGTGSKVATSGTVTASRCAEWDANGTLVSSAGACGKGVVAGSNISLTDNGTTVTVSATPATGSVTSTNGTSVDGELALFSGTSGTQIKRATGSGFLKATSGVLSSVSGIQATDIVAASKQGTGSKVVTSGTVTASRCAEWDATGTLVSAAGGCNSAQSVQSGWYAPLGIPAGTPATATLASAANDIRAMWFAMPFSMAISRVGFYVAVATSVAGCEFRAAMYDGSGQLLAQTDPASHSGPAGRDINTTGYKYAPFASAVNIQAGTAYYISWSSTCSDLRIGAPGSATIPAVLNSGPTVLFGRSPNQVNAGAFPAALGSLVANVAADTGTYAPFLLLL